MSIRILSGLCMLCMVAAAEEARFEVHEWGVFVREQVSVVPYSQKGVALKAQENSALLSAPVEMLSGLPGFVLRHPQAFKPERQYRSWDKPVIHLYGKEGLRVSVTVATPLGYPTAYWPKPEYETQVRWRMGVGESEAVAMTWQGTLSERAPADLARAEAGHWWNTVRNVPAAYLKTDAGSERFIFYEGTALQEPTVTATVGQDAIAIRNAHEKPSGPVMLILNDGRRLVWDTIEKVPAQGEVRVERTHLLAERKQIATLEQACEAQWRSFGMTKEEAHAIVETWKPDLCERYGLLLISRMPEDLYEKMFPLTVTPQPDRIVRAGVVFDTLDDQDARAAWLPHLNEDMQQWAKDLAHEDFAVRDKARTRFAQVLALARPFLEKLQTSDDTEVRISAQSLLEDLEAPTMTQPLGAAEK